MGIATCNFFLALWKLYCSLAHSLHPVTTGNKKPTWNPEAWWCKKEKKKKNKAWPAALGWPHRWRYGDKRGAPSHGLAPVGSKLGDEQILSTILFYPLSTHLPKLSYRRIAFVHTQKLITAVKQYVGEIRHRYQNCTHKPQCEASLFPVGLVVGVFMCMTCLPQWEEKLLYQLRAVLTDSLKTHSAMKMWLLLCNRMHNITFVRSWGSLTHSTTWWLSQLQALSVLILRSAKSLSCSELMCTSPKVRKPTKINTNLWVASQLNWNSSCWKSWSCLCGGLCYGVWQVNWVNQN